MTWNREEVLAPVAPEHRNEVSLYANGSCNRSGGRYSDALRAEVREYVKLGGEEYLRREREYRKQSSFYPSYN